ncbi:family 43 glycosylhydrolase [Saccharothrix sp. NRRL B-16314]|uniref:family 43 glycosylhydrolase n=1 Tax=Saccharothrix sp. NRRL B-16314 TaxID=1463825 RepID=UPI0012DE897B|nr:family 43 glycosylhydrolase [Saccharothrix sp. NRRL B-16314]
MPRRTGALALSLLVLASALGLPPSPASAATMPTGARSLEAVNYPGRFIRHFDYLGRLDPVTSGSTAQTKQDATFTVTSGLASPSCYSFQAANGMFLRHEDWRVGVEANAGTAQFRTDATFCAVDGSATGTVSLAPFNYPDRRVRHRDFGLWIDTYQDTAGFRADSSFRLTAPWTPKSTKGPVIPGLYADPHITNFNGRYYLYPTTDGYASWASPYYKAFSSTDLVNWTDHGVILDHGPDVSWADNSAWAPAVVAKNGRYYLYFSGGAASGDTGKHLGVAVSDSPTGPFRDALGRPLVRAGAYPGQAIDPMVFTDDDGQSYLYWGNGAAYVVPLNADMTSFDPAKVRTITTTGFREAAFVLKRNGTYYFMWSENDTRDEDYQVAYATGPSPLGPWTKRGVVLQKRLDAGIKGPGHHSVVRAPGTDTWYAAYHRFAVPGGNGTNREVTVDRLTFGSDGTINPIVPTP